MSNDIRKEGGERYLNHSKKRSGWDDPLSEPQRTWIVPAECVGLESFAQANRYRKRHLIQYPGTDKDFGNTDYAKQVVLTRISWLLK